MKRLWIVAVLLFGISNLHAVTTKGSTQKLQRMDTTLECANLSADEQAFANKLSPLHKTMFCRHFSVEQRMEAIAIVQSTQGGTTAITSDHAVEIVMQSSRQTSTIPQSQQQQRMQMPQKEQCPYRH